MDLNKPMDFMDPNFAMMLRFTDTNKGSSRFWYTTDRGHKWRGPFAFPLLGQPGIAARTDYLVNGKLDMLIFLTASKRDGKEGRPLCARTEDGGMTWKFVSWIGSEPAGFSIMPSTVRLSKRELATATRVKYDGDSGGIELYRSLDDGASWQSSGRPVAWNGPFSGNPRASSLREAGCCSPTECAAAALSDLRAVEHRRRQGLVPMRSSCATTPRVGLGYVRSAQRPDGNIVTCPISPNSRSRKDHSRNYMGPGTK